MSIITRQSFKSSIFSYLGVLIGAFNVLWLQPRLLSSAEIGIIGLLESFGSISATLASLGLISIADKFFPRFKNREAQHNGYLLLLSLYALMGFSLFLLVFFGFLEFWKSLYAEESPDALPYFHYAAIFTAGYLFIALFESYSRIHLRTVIPNFLREVCLRLLIMFWVFAYALDYLDFEALIILRGLAYGLVMLGLITYLAYLGILFWRANWAFLSWKLLREIFVYGLFVVLGSAGTVVIIKIDMMMVPALLGTSELGIYTIAFFMGTVIEIPRKMLAQISSPVISQAWAENNTQKIEQIYRESSLNQLIIGGAVFILIWASIDDIFRLIPNGEEYEQGKYVVLFIGLTRLVDMATGLNYEIIMQSKYFRFNFWTVSLLAGLIILSNLWFIPLYGITGAALATFLSYAIYNLSKFVFIWWQLGMQPFTKAWLIAALLLLANYYLGTYLTSLDSALLSVLYRSLILASVLLFTILGFGVSPLINDFWKKFWQAINKSR